MDWNTFQAILWGIIVGAISGGGASLIGYLKGKTLDTVDWAAAFTTVVLGIIVGGVAGYEHVSFDNAYQIILALGLVTFINQVTLMIYRRALDWWNRHQPPTPVVSRAKKNAS